MNTSDGISNAKTKRKYSKGGCRECKRRKIKCNEVKPTCFQCLRLNKECSYPLPGERVARVSTNPRPRRQKPSSDSLLILQYEATKLVEFASIATSLNEPNNDSPISTESPARANGVTLNEIHRPDSNDSVNNSLAIIGHINVLPQKEPVISTSVHHSPSNGDSLSYLGDQVNFFDKNDFNTLATDLQLTVQDMMKNSLHLGNEPLNPASTSLPLNLNSPYTSSSLHNLLHTPLSHLSSIQGNIPPDIIIPKNIPLGYVAVKDREEIYLKEFYDDFSCIICPLYSFDSKNSSYYNPSRDILFYCAKNEPVLLSAMLSQGAILSFRKTKLPEDEAAYDKYLFQCLNLLGTAILNYSLGALNSSIEIVLLTVLLLTSANAASISQNWRPHLQGAKALLLKSNIAISKATKTDRTIVNSNLLIYCKYWFISFEILAGVSSKYGGTLSKDELDLLLVPYSEHEISVMKSMGFITPEGFNLLGGYHNDSIIHFRDLIKKLIEVRTGETMDFDKSLDTLQLLSKFQDLLSTTFFHEEGIICNNMSKLGSEPSPLLLDRIKVGENTYVVSWLDICHQSYMLASMVSILNKVLEVTADSMIVQCLTKKLISKIKFMRDTNLNQDTKLLTFSLIMLQWPMSVAAVNCQSEEEKLLLTNFFKILPRLGSASGGLALKQLTKMWKRQQNNLVSSDEEAIDIVSY